MKDADVVLVHRTKIDVQLMDASPKFGLVIKCGVGVDAIAAVTATAGNIRVVNNSERGQDCVQLTVSAAFIDAEFVQKQFTVAKRTLPDISLKLDKCCKRARMESYHEV